MHTHIYTLIYTSGQFNTANPLTGMWEETGESGRKGGVWSFGAAVLCEVVIYFILEKTKI